MGKIIGLEQTFLDFFEGVDDPRIERCKLHPVKEIFLVTLMAVICGAEGWIDVEFFGRSKIDFLRRYLSFANGIPSDDTLRRFFRRLNPQVFRERFMAWVKTLSLPEETVIAIDGKTSRHSGDKDKSPLHMVSAFASESRLVLAQTKVPEKTNEITAIPDIVSWLDIKGAIITIDAMGCQKNIAEKITSQGGNYVLALKGNQGLLHEDVKQVFSDKAYLQTLQPDVFKEVDGGHGRIEERICRVVNCPDSLISGLLWPGLKTLVEVESRREFSSHCQFEKRYYISSLPKDAKTIAHAVRSHWGIENGLHWILDVSFRDDESMIRQGNAPENIAIIKHTALNLLQQSKRKRESIKRLRKVAGWDDRRLHAILFSENL